MADIPESNLEDITESFEIDATYIERMIQQLNKTYPQFACKVKEASRSLGYLAVIQLDGLFLPQCLFYYCSKY